MLDKPVFRRARQYVGLLAVQPTQHPVGRPRWRDRHCHRRCRHRTVDLVKAQIIAGTHEMGDATLPSAADSRAHVRFLDDMADTTAGRMV